MKINTNQKKKDGIPVPQFRVRTNVKSGISFVSHVDKQKPEMF